MESPAGIEVRPVAEADVETLHQLIVELATYEKLRDEVVGDAETLRRTLFDQRAAEAFLVEDGGEVVGYAIVYVTFSSFECRSGFWLEDLYVRPERRRGGVGREVMERLAALALERGHVRLEWCALDWNRPALDFYAGLGAVPLDGWRMLRLDRAGIERLAVGNSTRLPRP